MKYIFIFIAITMLYSCNPSSGDKKIKKIIQTSSSRSTQFIQEFDERGNLIHSEYDYDKHGPSDEIYKYYYEKDNLMKMEWFFRNGKNTRLYMTDYYTYNQDSTIHTKIRKDSDDKVYWEFKYKYKKVNGKKELTIYQYENNGELLQEWFYKYDSIGRVIQEPRDYDGSIIGTLKYEYFGNDSVQITEFSEEGETSGYVESYKIDKNGNYIDRDNGNTKYKWKYDKFGNWIEKEVIQENNSWIEYREIIYY